MEDQLSQSKLASSLLILAGIWLAVSPIFISITGGALASIIATGIIIALAGLVQYFWDSSVPSWIAGLAAVWLFVSTFVFGLSGNAASNQVILTIVTLALAYWDGFEITQVHHYRQMRRAM